MKRVSNTSNNNSPVAGWKLQDENYLRKYDSAEVGPDIQILDEDEWEDENLEQREYFCAICKARLDYLEGTETIWRCNECMQFYDTSIQDVPIKDLSGSKVKVYTELDRYPTYDESDVFLPFVEGIDPDPDTDVSSSGIEIVYDDGRHKHIRVKGLPTEALAMMNEMDRK